MQLKKLEEALLNEEEKYKLELNKNKELESKLFAQKDTIELLRKETIDYKFFYIWFFL